MKLHRTRRFHYGVGLTILLLFTLVWNSRGTNLKRTIPLHFIADVDGEKVLSNISRLLENHDSWLTTPPSFSHPSSTQAHFNQVEDESTAATFGSLEHLLSEAPLLQNLWNNTSMLFGASADGIGIATAFAIEKSSVDSAVFITNFHAVEHFCEVPEAKETDQIGAGDLRYPCNGLFVLHDISINIKNNEAEKNGLQPWKTEVSSLRFFSKNLDLAIFQVSLPADNNIAIPMIEVGYDLARPLIDQRPITDFDVTLIGYSLPQTPESSLIEKHWYQGKIKEAHSFESYKKMGWVTALEHSIAAFPGTSGSPLALSDGRVIGINTSAEINEFFARSGCSRKFESYSSYFAIPTPYLKSVGVKL